MATAMTELPPAAELPRPRTLLVGTSLALAGAAMYFAAIMGIYALERQEALRSGSEWFSPGTVQVAPGVVMWFTVLLSVVTMQWAVYALARNIRVQAYLALLLTLMFGGAVINQTSFYLTDIGLGIGESTASAMLFTVVGSFLALLMVAMLAVMLTSVRALIGQYSSQRTDGVVAASMIWYLMVAVYTGLWLLIFVTK